MKIRYGYVSNSSSSSFVVVGKRIGNIFESNIENKIDLSSAEYAMIGKYFFDDEGDDFIHLTPDVLKWIVDRKYDLDWQDGDIIEIVASGENKWSETCIEIPDGYSGLSAFSITASDHSSKDIEDLERNYIKRG